jgi:hypothetical protein
MNLAVTEAQLALLRKIRDRFIDSVELPPRNFWMHATAKCRVPSPTGDQICLGWPGRCSAQFRLDAERGTVWPNCQDNGLLMLNLGRRA